MPFGWRHIDLSQAAPRFHWCILRRRRASARRRRHWGSRWRLSPHMAR